LNLQAFEYLSNELPGEPGSYALRLALCTPLRLVVGRLGEFSFPASVYLYLGSAHGPGGLRARLRHHARVSDQPHWHLDWLRPYAEILGGWYVAGPDPLECAWSQALLHMPGVAVPAPGFGAADCRKKCKAHFLALPEGLSQREIAEILYTSAGHRNQGS
jgi:Uri superfamily endonuclease